MIWTQCVEMADYRQSAWNLRDAFDLWDVGLSRPLSTSVSEYVTGWWQRLTQYNAETKRIEPMIHIV